MKKPDVSYAHGQLNIQKGVYCADKVRKSGKSPWNSCSYRSCCFGDGISLHKDALTGEFF
ncbi:hypothetical protein C5167_022343 [Papaver somniferum]|uniref:Uncharacterized protein n=1 Tax=Papaver somniferum TaxID=3469 RepID=A0A4Y7JKN1_PAPSO|nr:hypothetical protein C5167_022343 [Papaver somniferum]